MTDFELLIPVDCGDSDENKPVQTPVVSRSSSFSRLSLARFSQRLRRRGSAIGDEPDKENVAVVGGRTQSLRTVVRKCVKFDKRVYHGPIRDRRDQTLVTTHRGILKTSPVENGRPQSTQTTIGYSNTGYDDAVPNRMRMYDIPVTSFYIGANEHLQLMTLTTTKRCSSSAMVASEVGGQKAKKIRRFGTELGSYGICIPVKILKYFVIRTV